MKIGMKNKDRKKSDNMGPLATFQPELVVNNQEWNDRRLNLQLLRDRLHGHVIIAQI